MTSVLGVFIENQRISCFFNHKKNKELNIRLLIFDGETTFTYILRDF